MEHLGYSWQDVHKEAERLEHAVSDEFTERLAELLGIRAALRTAVPYLPPTAP